MKRKTVDYKLQKTKFKAVYAVTDFDNDPGIEGCGYYFGHGIESYGYHYYPHATPRGNLEIREKVFNQFVYPIWDTIES